MKRSPIRYLISTMLLLCVAWSGRGQQIATSLSNDRIAFLLATYEAADERDVIPPHALRTKFMSDFPQARKAEWEAATGVFECEFKIKEKKCKAFYDINGNLLSYNEEIRERDIPSIVKNRAYSHYKNYKIDEAKKIYWGSVLVYCLEMEKRNSDVTLFINADGTISLPVAN